MEATLYTRQGCHLCDDAQRLLEKHGVRVKLVDIDQQAELCKQFDTCVPVVEINGKLRFRGRVNEMLLTRLLNHERDASG
jgi:glutaredoxin